MSDAPVVPVKVRILDRDYQFACPEDEKEMLLDSARHLNDRMKEIRDSGKVVGMDRIAVMAALNLARELLETRDEQRHAGDAESRLRSLNKKLDSVLGPQTGNGHGKSGR